MTRKVWILLIIFCLAGITGGYLFLKKRPPGDKPPLSGSALPSAQGEDDTLSVLRIYYPGDNSLTMVEKRVPLRTKPIAIAEAVIEEYFKGPEGRKQSVIPRNVKLLGLYRDDRQVLYIDLSDELRRNFQGDALSEYLLLKGIYESIASNLRDFQDIKILVEGKEIETIGGHFYLKYPLKAALSYEYAGEESIDNNE